MNKKFMMGLFCHLYSGDFSGNSLGWDGDQQLGQQLDEIVVTAQRPVSQPLNAVTLSADALDLRRHATSDTADLLRNVPGVGLQGAGGISSLPVIHGLADDRVRTQVDGMSLMAVCPNHMNPALSYIDPSQVGRINVYAGITPVSVGGDSLGGTIQIESATPVFAAPGQGNLISGQVGAFYRGNGNVLGAYLGTSWANEKLNLRIPDPP